MIMTLLSAAPPENIWDITIGPYTNLIGDFFWAVLLFIMVILVWMKTQSFGPTFLTGTVGLLVLSAWMPSDVQTIFIFAIAIGITYAFYQLLVRRRPY